MIYTVRESEDSLWTVGTYAPDVKDWLPMRDFNSRDAAFAFINYLNGGDGEVWDG